MMKEFCIEMEVGDANPLSFFSFGSTSAYFLVGDLLAVLLSFPGEDFMVFWGERNELFF